MPNNINLDDARLYSASGISLSDLTILYDYDTEDEFIKSLEAKLINKTAKQYLSQLPPGIDPLQGVDLQHIKNKVIAAKLNPERVSRLLLIDIIAYAKSLATFEEIMAATGKSEYELLKLISREEIQKYNAEALIMIRKVQFDAAIEKKDVKMLTHLGQSYIDAQAPKKQEVNINVDNRTVKYVELPKKENLEDFSKYWIADDNGNT